MGGESCQNSTIRPYFFVGLKGPFFTHVSSSGEACLVESRRHVSSGAFLSRAGGTFLSSGEACLFEKKRRVAREAWHSP